ncbi:hypothetical protein ACIP10_27655 [Streptomyces galbus]|uniref:hypothetical protein n=1 Tax=Streptomyces galbus TaxID=33898 RepID=UPI0037961E63
MGIETYLAVADLLRSRDFPDRDGRAELGFGGPGHFTAELRVSQGLRDADPAVRAARGEEFRAESEHLVDGLAARWGEPFDHGLQGIRLRTEKGEIPEPWAGFSTAVAHACVWEPSADGRWAAVGVADLDPSDEIRLLLVVTEVPLP